MGTTTRYFQSVIFILLYLTVSCCYADVVVPNVLGLSLDDAKKTLQNNDLSLGSIKNQRTNRPVGTVIVQAPSANKQVKEGYPIRLVIAIPLVKPKTTKVPNLKGMSFSQAKAAISKANLRLGTVKKRKIKMDNEEVLYQSPKAGKAIVVKSKVNLTLSDPIESNDPKVKVIVDKTRIKAGESILITAHVSNTDPSKTSEYGFSINGKTHYSTSSSYRHTFSKSGRYILTASFRYTRGKWYASLSKTVNVSSSKIKTDSPDKKPTENNDKEKSNAIKTPNVVGLSLASAKREIRKAGLALGKITKKEDDSGKNRILKQSPRADKLIKKGSAVDLTLSIAPSKAWQKPNAVISPSTIKVVQGEKARFYSQSTYDAAAQITSSWTSKTGQKTTGNRFKIDTHKLKEGRYWIKLSIKDNKNYTDTASAVLLVTAKQSTLEKDAKKEAQAAKETPKSKLSINSKPIDKQVEVEPTTNKPAESNKKITPQQETINSNYIEALTIEANNTTESNESALSSETPIQKPKDSSTLTMSEVNSQHKESARDSGSMPSKNVETNTEDSDYYWFVWVWLLLVLFIIGTLLLILWRYRQRHRMRATAIDFQPKADAGKQEILMDSQTPLQTIHFNPQIDKGEQEVSVDRSKKNERNKSDDENKTD